MKASYYYSTARLLLLLLIMMGCSSDDNNNDDGNNQPEVIDFTATFTTSQAADAFTEFCQDDPTENDFWGIEHQVGDGTMTGIGDIEVDITFCIHIVYDENSLPDPENGFGVYYSIDEDSYFEDDNGDRIFFETDGDGLVYPSDDENYVLEFQDNFVITGGTGAYAGASGSMSSDSYVDINGLVTHTWEGTLVIPADES